MWKHTFGESLPWKFNLTSSIATSLDIPSRWLPILQKESLEKPKSPMMWIPSRPKFMSKRVTAYLRSELL